jgi:hypothetical protein
MKIQQLSVFLEIERGWLSKPCRILGDAGVNILTMSLAETQQFGIFRLIVRDWDKAKTALESGGYVVTVTDVVAAEVADRPGGLAEVLEVLEQAGVDVEYLHAFTYRHEGKAVILFRFEDPDAAVELFQSNGIAMLASNELYDLVEPGG